jgi:LysM domain
MMRKDLTHEQAIQLVHFGSDGLNVEQRTALVEHLSGCTGCRDYATHLEVLGPLLHRAMSNRWDPVIPPGDVPGTLINSTLSSAQIASRIRGKTMEKRIFNFIGNAVGVVALLIVLFVAFNRLRPGQNLQTAINSTETVVPATIPEPTVTSSSTGRTDVITYTIQNGDTIYGIAKQYNLQPETIFWANINAPLDSTYILKPGMTIIILPVDGIYRKWTAGESLLGIARIYGVKPEDIVNWPGNHLDPNRLGDWSNPNIATGTMLIIPGGHLDFTNP